MHSIYNVLKLRSTTIFCFQYSSRTQPPLIRHPCLNSGLFEHRVQTLLKSSRISSTSKFQTYRICSRSHRKTNHPHIQMISELPDNSYCSLLFYYPYYTKVITIKIPKYLADCLLPLPNWGVSFYFGNLLQLTCFLLLPYWGSSPHFQVFAPTSLLPTPIHILKTQNKTSIYVALFYCVLTLYTIYRKSRLSILFDRQGDPSFGYIFI